MKEHTIWVEKYRPINLNNFISDNELKSKFQSFIDKQDLPMLGFFGKPGSGKTTLAKILAKNINCDYLYLNATEDRDMETIKNKVGSFAAAASFKPLKIVVLDEATHILQASQVLLLNMMETYALKTRFILTGNFPERLIEPLRSRLQEFILVPPSKKEIAIGISTMLEKEEITFELKDIATIINNNYPDLRKIINTCQKLTIDSVLTVNINDNKGGSEYLDQIIEELIKPTNKTFTNIRQIIANNKVNDFTNVYKHIYDKINTGIVAIIIAEHEHMATSRIDQEICFMAAIQKILNI